MDLRNASAIVTGGGSGLGAATAAALADRGTHVIVLDRNPKGAELVASAIGGTAFEADVADAEQIDEAVKVAGDAGPLRVLVNCAGITHVSRVVSREGVPFDIDAFERVVRVNLIGTFNCVRLAAVAMGQLDPLPSGERGSILNTASVAAFDGQVGQAAYAASKGGIVGLTLPLARDLAALSIRVNAIAPGLFDTPIYGTGEKAEAWKAELGASVVFPKRLGVPEEFADIAMALLSNSYVNGEVVRIDGAIRLSPR